jgi:hypothetical protein
MLRINKEAIIQFVHDKLGIDKAIAFTASTRTFQFASTIFIIYFTTRFLSPDEQGYSYTFASILALQIFFELGFTGIITQFVAHESSHLSWSDNYALEGEDKYKSRLSSLIHFCIKWYSRIAGLLLITLIVAGIFFFQKFDKTNNGITWRLPWILLVLGTCLNFIISPIASFLQGIGKVKEIAKVRFFQQIISPIIYCGTLAMGFKLFASGFMAFVTAFVFFYLLFSSSLYKYLKSIWAQPVHEKVSYKNEVFPYQWRIALSWISGYFIFQLFNPVLFATEGPVIAGQMGMTLSGLNGITALSLSWIETKVPLFSVLIARKQYSQLDSIFKKVKNQSVIINGLCILVYAGTLFIIRKFNIQINQINLGVRFLDYFPFFLMSILTFTNQYVSSWAIYLRCHNKEPYMVNSVVTAVLCALAIFTLGYKYGLMGLIGGCLVIRLISFFWAHLIYKKYRLLWHNNL